MTSAPSLSATGVVVFAYDFPHRKTQDLVVRLRMEGIPVGLILAAPKVELGIPPATVRTKVRSGGLVHPRAIAAALDIRYSALPHDDPAAVDLLDEIRPDLGVVAGARVLPGDVIRRFGTGIVNLHPGWIPGARGLDALLWSIIDDVPPGVTAHLIDERVDAGRLILRRRIEVLPDDTVFDLSERLHVTQLDLLRPSFAAAPAAEPFDDLGPYHAKMPPDLEREAIHRAPSVIARWAQRSQEAGPDPATVPEAR